MKKLTIGRAIINYSPDGKVTTAHFEPAIKVNLVPWLENQLLDLKSNDPEAVQKNADIVLGAWFSKMNEVELRDDTKQVVSNILACEKYPDGTVASCVLEYIFQDRPELSN